MPDMTHLTLAQVEQAYLQGTVTDGDVRAYLIKWNATPGRLTRAELRDGRIRNTAVRAAAEASRRPVKLDLEYVLACAQGDGSTGFCLACGHEQDGCEPDARGYECEACGAMRVYGAEEILIMRGGV